MNNKEQLVEIAKVLKSKGIATEQYEYEDSIEFTFNCDKGLGYRSYVTALDYNPTPIFSSVERGVEAVLKALADKKEICDSGEEF